MSETIKLQFYPLEGGGGELGGGGGLGYFTKFYTGRLCPGVHPLNLFYYSFKIFLRFRLAKSTRLIHHNQLLMTKFGRILTLTRK